MPSMLQHPGIIAATSYEPLKQEIQMTECALCQVPQLGAWL